MKIIFWAEHLFNKFIKYQDPNKTNVVNKLINTNYSRMVIDEKFKYVINKDLLYL